MKWKSKICEWAYTTASWYAYYHSVIIGSTPSTLKSFTGQTINYTLRIETTLNSLGSLQVNKIYLISHL